MSIFKEMRCYWTKLHQNLTKHFGFKRKSVQEGLVTQTVRRFKSNYIQIPFKISFLPSINGKKSKMGKMFLNVCSLCSIRSASVCCDLASPECYNLKFKFSWKCFTNNITGFSDQEYPSFEMVSTNIFKNFFCYMTINIHSLIQF